MTLTCGTYGIGALNQSFLKEHFNERRDNITSFKTLNFVFNIMGYTRFIPGVSVVGGTLRIVTAIYIMCVQQNRPTSDYPDIDHSEKMSLKYEYIAYGVNQVARGILEAFMPGGHLVVLAFDGIGTLINGISNCRKGALASVYNNSNFSPSVNTVFSYI